MAQPGAKPIPMRPARISGADETMIFVECRPDIVVVYPSRQQIGIDSLNHTPPHNPLTKAVNQIITQQQARVRAGLAPARFHLRFLVHPGAELSYHRAYPALETVPVPKSRYALMGDDSVPRIIAGY